MTTLIERLENFISITRPLDEEGRLDNVDDVNEVFREHMVGCFSSQDFPGLNLLLMRDSSGRLIIDQRKAFIQFETIAELAEQAAEFDAEQPHLHVARFVLGLLGEILAAGESEGD